MSLKTHGTLTPNRDASQNIPKSGGIKTALMVLISTVKQATSNTGRNLNQWYAQSRGNSSIIRSMKSHHPTKDPGI